MKRIIATIYIICVALVNGKKDTLIGQILVFFRKKNKINFCLSLKISIFAVRK